MVAANEYSLSGYLSDGSIVLADIPSKKYPAGKSYRFASPVYEVGLWLKNLIELGQRVELGAELTDEQVAGLVLNDNDENDVYRKVMGDTLDQLGKDGVTWTNVQEIFTILLRKWGAGQDIEVQLREAAGESLPGSNRQAKRASARNSSPKAGSRSSRASSATKAPTGGRASTRSSATSGHATRAS